MSIIYTIFALILLQSSNLSNDFTKLLPVVSKVELDDYQGGNGLFIYMQRLTHEQVIQDLCNSNEHYGNNIFRITEEYKNRRTKILCEDDYGLTKMNFQSLLLGAKPNIKSAVNPTEYFKNMLLDKNPFYKNGEFWVKGDYVADNIGILCEDKFGIINPKPSDLLNGSKPTIKCAINPTDYFKCQLHEKSEPFRIDKFRVKGEYKGTEIKILIEDSCGELLVSVKNLLQGVTPNIISAVDKTQYWINMMRERYGDNIDNYSKANYIDNSTEIEIICRKGHGSFWQIPMTHYYRGSGCPICAINIISQHNRENPHGWGWKPWKAAAKRSKDFDSFKLYIIRCWNDEEEFFKIGRTYKSIQKRFASKHEMPYNFEVIKTIESKRAAKRIYDLENQLKKEHKLFKYEPKIWFGGESECFTQILLNKIN